MSDSTARVPAAVDEPAWPLQRVAASAVLLTLGAALVRGLARPGRPMWLDEAMTLAMARAPAAEGWEYLVHREVNGGIYTVLVGGLLALAGPLGVDDLALARGLSACFGVAAVPAFYLLARRLFGEPTALLAGLLLAVSQFHAYYSIEARAYSLAVLLVVLSTWALVALLDEPRWGRVLAFGLLAGLATWAHLFAALLLAGQGLAALAHPRPRAGWSALVGGLGLGGALSGLVVAAGLRADGGQVDWVQPLSLDQVAMVFVRLAGSSRLLLLPFLGGLLVAVARLRRGARTDFPAALAVALVLVPVLLAALVSTVKPLLVPRYLLVALPGFLLLAALGVAALRRPVLVVGAAALLAGLGLREVARDHRAEPRWQPIDRVAARLVEVARPGDALVVSHPALALSLDRELARLGRGPGPVRISPVAGDPLDLQGDRHAPLPEQVRGHAGTIFMLFAEQPRSERLRLDLSADGAVTDDEWFDGVRLLRVARR